MQISKRGLERGVQSPSQDIHQTIQYDLLFDLTACRHATLHDLNVTIHTYPRGVTNENIYKNFQHWSKTWSKEIQGIFQTNPTSTVSDENIRNELKVRAVTFEVEEWWAGKKPSLVELSWENMDAESDQVTAKMSNPYAGKVYGRQLEETVEEFLQRLPPATTQVTTKFLEWAQFFCEGKGLLEPLVTSRHDVEKKHVGKASKATVTKVLNSETKEVFGKPLNTAVDLRCTSGKQRPRQAAKVAPDDGQVRNPHLICIYTRNFEDRGDVRRVLHNLKDLGFVEKGRPIYYKCDAYTHLALKHLNDYNIAASMYSAEELT
ncbi:unnamed protein product [Diplocarpon coronariae]